MLLLVQNAFKCDVAPNSCTAQASERMGGIWFYPLSSCSAKYYLKSEEFSSQIKVRNLLLISTILKVFVIFIVLFLSWSSLRLRIWWHWVFKEKACFPLLSVKISCVFQFLLVRLLVKRSEMILVPALSKNLQENFQQPTRHTAILDFFYVFIPSYKKVTATECSYESLSTLLKAP